MNRCRISSINSSNGKIDPDWVDVFPIEHGDIPAISMWSFTRGYINGPEPEPLIQQLPSIDIEESQQKTSERKNPIHPKAICSWNRPLWFKNQWNIGSVYSIFQTSFFYTNFATVYMACPNWPDDIWLFKSWLMIQTSDSSTCYPLVN